MLLASKALGRGSARAARAAAARSAVGVRFVTRAANAKAQADIDDFTAPIDQAAVTRWMEGRDTFARRHIGPGAVEEQSMIDVVGTESMEDLLTKTIPPQLFADNIVHRPALGERALLDELEAIGAKNEIFESYLGQGYFNCSIPCVIKRGVLENPGWYTQYTPYQAEISQGRMETLFNFQTMICELTSLDIANASLLDEPTAAGEAMTMSYTVSRGKKPKFLVDRACNPATIDLLKSRAAPIGIDVHVVDVFEEDITSDTCGVMFQYPSTHGSVDDFAGVVDSAKAAGAMSICATDLLALTKLKSPGEFGVDIAVGSAQRFGVPLGYGGPHAAFIATSTKHMRKLPGRIIGKSIDSNGQEAYRLALQTREQHIRRGKAVSNICTAQALLANISALYGMYHGPQGLQDIADRVHGMACVLASGIESDTDHELISDVFFDTVAVKLHGVTADDLIAAAYEHKINLRKLGDSSVSVSLDETVSHEKLATLLSVFVKDAQRADDLVSAADSDGMPSRLDGSAFERESEFMAQSMFNKYHSETEMMRYLKYIENKDLSLCHSMIPLGSCTMKLNSAVEMQALTWPEFADIHPFAPPQQAAGYHEMFAELKSTLLEITGYDGMSLQPNSGAQGELAGLMAIRAYHASRGDADRNVCLIPVSAHGTNPASAAMAGMKAVDVAVTDQGEIDMTDFTAKVEKHSSTLAAVMITYPSTYGVFEDGVDKLCDLVHEHGGQVYLDGANMNANSNLVRPGDVGADVSHLNLHKTFCIPHGGGGPGMGPIGVKEQLIPFLPAHKYALPGEDGEDSGHCISGAPYGSSLISTISWAYLKLMGSDGIRKASEVAILNANYMASRLAAHYPIRFLGQNGFVAHEFIIDCSSFKRLAGVEVVDIAKRLQDYGLHAPTMSWPVSNALMIEPTESENLQALDDYCDALIRIRKEIRDIEEGRMPRDNNPLKNSPHTLDNMLEDDWAHPYTRSVAAFPNADVARTKFWPSVGRVDDVYGDKNLNVRA